MNQNMFGHHRRIIFMKRINRQHHSMIILYSMLRIMMQQNFKRLDCFISSTVRCRYPWLSGCLLNSIFLIIRIHVLNCVCFFSVLRFFFCTFTLIIIWLFLIYSENKRHWVHLFFKDLTYNAIDSWKVGNRSIAYLSMRCEAGSNIDERANISTIEYGTFSEKTCFQQRWNRYRWTKIQTGSIYDEYIYFKDF